MKLLAERKELGSNVLWHNKRQPLDWNFPILTRPHRSFSESETRIVQVRDQGIHDGDGIAESVIDHRMDTDLIEVVGHQVIEIRNGRHGAQVNILQIVQCLEAGDPVTAEPVREDKQVVAALPEERIVTGASVGLARAKVAMTLANIGYNMRRWSWLNGRSVLA